MHGLRPGILCPREVAIKWDSDIPRWRVDYYNSEGKRKRKVWCVARKPMDTFAERVREKEAEARKFVKSLDGPCSN